MTNPHLEGLIALADEWDRQAQDPAFPSEDERAVVEAEDAMCVMHAAQLRKAIAALAALPGGGVDGWQPIETAPYADFEGTHPITCLVYSKRFGVQMGRAWRYTYGEACGQAIGFTGNWEVTHWMPLPSSPTPTPHEADRNG